MDDAPLLLAIDEGTTSTRALALDLTGNVVAAAARPVSQYYPQPGWVEQDAAQLWEATLAAAQEVVERVGAGRIAAIGLTNQRETVVFFDRVTGEPLAPAIVWQDRRSAELCAALRADGIEPHVQATTGLLLDPYFSATKMRWALDHWPALARAADAGRLAIGTIDTYLLHRLTRGALFATDATNAARTLLMHLQDCRWDRGMMELFGVDRALLPAITACYGQLGETEWFGRPIPVTGCAGDQQAAAIGQGCLEPGLVKVTYGTGAFMIAHAGDTPPVSSNRLLSTLAWQAGDGRGAYALEGSIFVAGSALQWLRDALGIVASVAESEALAHSVPDTHGVTFVPAFAGLGAPHWRADARGLIAGLTAGATRAHIVRAALESIAQQTADLFDALRADGVAPLRLRIDGGMAANGWFCQHLADTLAMTVERPAMIETTALGAAMLAGVGAGLFSSLDEAQAMWRPDRTFTPALTGEQRDAERARWRAALAQALAGA